MKKTHTDRDIQWPRTVAFLAAKNTQILDVAGPYQIFVRAGEAFVRHYPQRACPYHVVLITANEKKSVQTNCGLILSGAIGYRRFREPIDTLLVAGGTSLEMLESSQKLLAWLRARANRARRFGSICTGAFLLGSAGLLDGRRVATHWKWAAQLASKCKLAIVDPDPIYIRDGKLYTSAGITAGMDLALALVEEDLGPPIALEVARDMVMFLRRAGGQSQFSTVLSLQASDRNQLQELRTWITENLMADLNVSALAARAGMSPRNFARVFGKETGTTPGEFVQRIRVEAARRRLEESRDKLEKVAADCGFGSVNGLRRSFLRLLDIAPSEYRRRFTSARQT
jgi:transcriptional regulator GlxA family with amidase domain